MERNTELFVNEYVKKNTFWYHFWKVFFTPIAWILYRPKFYGKENIPTSGGVILACNHIHMADPAYIVLATNRVVRFLAKRELLDSILRPIYMGFCAIPVDRKASGHNPMVAAEYALQNGEVVGIFPEGTRNRKDYKKLLPFKYGTVLIASKMNVPIVPIVLISKGRPFIDRYHVYIGEPYYVDKDADLDKENEILKNKMLALMDKAV